MRFGNQLFTFHYPMIRHLSDISPTSTSYDAGLKQVLLSANESGCSITQIAVMHFRAGDVMNAHVHPDLQDNFYILSGTLLVTLDGVESVCTAQDFIHVPHGVVYELQAQTDVDVLTCGCVVEAERRKLYPMLFDPNLHPVVWGGNRIKPWKSLTPKSSVSDSQNSAETADDLHIGESWEVSAISDSPSVVSNGTWAGYLLTDVIARRPKEILGRKVAEKYHGQLPLLAKFIDSAADLSIQVHPDDAMAMREHGKMGKSEMWYVIDAKPGAYLYAGFREQLTPEEYKRRVADGTIVDALARHEVRPGDVFYLPAGRVHAIGGGILLAEIQQSSDVTYRIFDYNRPGMDGRPRELHTALAAQALDYRVYDEYRTDHREAPNAVNDCLDTPYFSVRIVDVDQPKHRDLIRFDSFVILMCTRGECTIRARATGDEVLLREGYSCLIPAAIADYDIIPSTHAHLLEAYIDNQPRTLRELITGFFHLSGR